MGIKISANEARVVEKCGSGRTAAAAYIFANVAPDNVRVQLLQSVSVPFSHSIRPWIDG